MEHLHHGGQELNIENKSSFLLKCWEEKTTTIGKNGKKTLQLDVGFVRQTFTKVY